MLFGRVLESTGEMVGEHFEASLVLMCGKTWESKCSSPLKLGNHGAFQVFQLFEQAKGPSILF
jgi:hypothetical protein